MIFPVLVLYISVGHYLAEKHIAELPGAASLHAVCPFGGVVKHIICSPMAATFREFTLRTSLSWEDYWPRSFWQGPFLLVDLSSGSVQEWVGKLGKRVLRLHYNKVPVLLDKILKFGKYLMLLFVIIQTARTATLLFSNFDPYYNPFNIWTDEIAITGYIAVILTLGASFFVEQPFCRYACPLGAITGLFNSFSLIKIRRRPSTCIDCELCDIACPVGLDVSKETVVRSPACSRCLKCVAVCPVDDKGTLTTRTFFSRSDTGKKGIPARIYILVAALAFLLPIMISVFVGAFETEKGRVYIVPEDIKGSTSFAEIIDNFSVSREQLFNSLEIPESASVELKIKDLTGILGFAGEEEVISREYIALLVERYSDPITSLAEHSKADFVELLSLVESSGLNGSDSVSEVMKEGPRGGLFTYLFSGRWPSETSARNMVFIEAPSEAHGQSTSIDIKGSTSLSEISSVVEDFDASRAFRNTRG